MRRKCVGQEEGREASRRIRKLRPMEDEFAAGDSFLLGGARLLSPGLGGADTVMAELPPTPFEAGSGGSAMSGVLKLSSRTRATTVRALAIIGRLDMGIFLSALEGEALVVDLGGWNPQRQQGIEHFVHHAARPAEVDVAIADVGDPGPQSLGV